VSEKFLVGLDLGYAIGASKGVNGGFYFRPMVGYSILETILLQASLSSISADGGSISNFSIGAVYGF